nr:unnamed protein product [Callosobruchus chinensis]
MQSREGQYDSSVTRS